MAVSCLFIRGISGAWLELCDPLELTRGHWQVRLMGLSPIWKQISSPFAPGLIWCVYRLLFLLPSNTMGFLYSPALFLFLFMSLKIIFCNRLKCHYVYQIVLTYFQCLYLFLQMIYCTYTAAEINSLTPTLSSLWIKERLRPTRTEWKKKLWPFNIAVFLTIASDRRPQTWLGGPGASLIGCQALVTPLMRGHILCDLRVS